MGIRASLEREAEMGVVAEEEVGEGLAVEKEAEVEAGGSFSCREKNGNDFFGVEDLG